VAIAIAFASRSAVMGTPIPGEVKKVVAFVYLKDAKGALVPNGTEFFVGIPLESDASRFFVYLVTARHVVAESETGPLLAKVWLRLEKKSGGTEVFEVPLISAGEHQTVFLHPDPTVDLAVIPVFLDQTKIEFRFLPASLVTSREDFASLRIAEGSDVFFTGLFTPHLGQQKNYPVVRFGRVALLSEEKVSWNGVPTDLYLIESLSSGGNSGSPVFLYLGADRTPGSLVVGTPDLRLAGVMKGAFQEGQPVRFAQTSSIPINLSNIGIAAVVPSYHLREILFGAELAKLRGLKSGG
jgi:hypothetical protein